MTNKEKNIILLKIFYKSNLKKNYKVFLKFSQVQCQQEEVAQI